MKYKVTALQDVTLRAYVPTEEAQWITLRAGQTREGLGLVYGVHPSSLPGEPAMHVFGVSLVPTPSWNDDQLPIELQGLYRLELQSVG